MKGSRGPADLPTIYTTDDSDTQNIKIRNANLGKKGGKKTHTHTHTQYLKNIHKNTVYRVSIKPFPDYKHFLQENYVEYKHIFFYHYLS